MQINVGCEDFEYALSSLMSIILHMYYVLVKYGIFAAATRHITTNTQQKPGST